MVLAEIMQDVQLYVTITFCTEFTGRDQIQIEFIHQQRSLGMLKGMHAENAKLDSNAEF